MKALGCVVMFSALALGLGGTIYFWPDPPAPPPLVHDADQIAELAKREPVFNRAVTERFSLGSPAQDLIHELMRQRFTPDRLMRHEASISTQQIWEDNSARATYKTRRFPCGFEYTVHWKTDEHRRLVAVRGTVRAICL